MRREVESRRDSDKRQSKVVQIVCLENKSTHPLRVCVYVALDLEIIKQVIELIKLDALGALHMPIVKIVVDADSDRILGAALMHVDSQEVINLVALAMRQGVTSSTLRDSIFTHPSSTEALNEVLGSFAR